MNELEIGGENDLNTVLLKKAVGMEGSSAGPKIIAAFQLPWSRDSRVRSGQDCPVECASDPEGCTAEPCPTDIEPACDAEPTCPPEPCEYD
jgi:hypothetical protein